MSTHSRATDHLPDDLAQWTIDQLNDGRAEVLSEMNAIRNQLASKKADIEAAARASGVVNGYGSPRGDPAAFSAYETWRAKATTALRHYEVEAMDLKTELRRRGVTEKPPKSMSAEAKRTHLWIAVYARAVSARLVEAGLPPSAWTDLEPQWMEKQVKLARLHADAIVNATPEIP